MKFFLEKNFFQKIPKFCRDVRGSQKSLQKKIGPSSINPRQYKKLSFQWIRTHPPLIKHAQIFPTRPKIEKTGIPENARKPTFPAISLRQIHFSRNIFIP